MLGPRRWHASQAAEALLASLQRSACSTQRRQSEWLLSSRRRAGGDCVHQSAEPRADQLSADHDIAAAASDVPSARRGNIHRSSESGVHSHCNPTCTAKRTQCMPCCCPLASVEQEHVCKGSSGRPGPLVIAPPGELDNRHGCPACIHQCSPWAVATCQHVSTCCISHIDRWSDESSCASLRSDSHVGIQYQPQRTVIK